MGGGGRKRVDVISFLEVNKHALKIHGFSENFYNLISYLHESFLCTCFLNKYCIYFSYLQTCYIDI